MDSQSNPRKITISPVTRIEGHAKITLMLDEAGNVADARFHVNEFRGFEEFCRGRLFTEMPTITPRICGICPVSHSLASAKACEMIMKLEPAYTGTLLRKLIHLGQIISSHALSFFHLSSPDFLLGWDSDPATRNIAGLAAHSPEVARRGIRLRQFGQELSARITGKKIHVMGIAPGGVLFPLTKENHRALEAWIPEAIETTNIGIGLLKKYMDTHQEEVRTFANFETLYMGLTGPSGEHEMYDGRIRVVDAQGNIQADQLLPQNYLDFIAERPVEWSYLKYPYFKPAGYPNGFYRVGPLARLNVAKRMRTPLAQKEFEQYRALAKGKPVNGTFYFHYARLIETLTAVELVREYLADPKVLSTETLSQAKRNQTEGVGCSEAPRGILFHHYKTDENGQLTDVNLLIATGQNNPAMNRSVLEVAKQYVKGPDVKEGALNRVEAAIRCYDPCLSCSTHAVGRMSLLVQIQNHKGEILREIVR
jgi:NAD-reducing hydrogenase large subunit